MSGYSQQTAKRQKIREAKIENDYFQGIDKIEYNNMASAGEAGSYRYYSCSERVHNRAMDDWLKYSVSFTEFRNYVSESHGRANRLSDDSSNSLESRKRSIKALYDLCSKLGVKYWTALDTDLVPWSENWDDMKNSWDDMVEFVQELTLRYHVKLLWLSPDLHSHARYASGALTSNDATTLVQAATQIKKCIDISQKVNAECFLLWPYKEGYENIFQTDVAKEIKLFAKLMKITAEYKEKLNYRCQLLIMPYYYFGRNVGGWQHSRLWEREMINMYMWDVTSCLYFLKNYNLERYFKVCTPPGHHMYMANAYNMLGGVTLTNDVDQCDTKTLTLMMKCILDQGAAPPGGVSLRLECRAPLAPRSPVAPRDVLTTFVSYVDGAARALRLAANILTEQLFNKHIQQRYATYYSGFGSRLVSGDFSMEECEEYHKKNQNSNSDVAASNGGHVELAFQRYIDTSDHI